MNEEEFKIDDFEKLFIIASAKINAAGEVDNETYNPDDFDEICNFAEFKMKHPELFDEKTVKPNQKDLNFYTIPITLGMGDNKIKSYVLVDNVANGLYIVLPNGSVIPAQELKNLTNIQTFLNKGALNEEEINELLKGNNGIKGIAEMIEQDELDIILFKERAAAKVKSKGLDLEELLKDNEVEENKEELEESEELEEEKKEEELERETEEEVKRAGIDFDIVKSIAAAKGCQVYQISIRELYRPEIIKERLGKDLDHHRGNLAIARINYGFKEEMIVVDKNNGNILVDNRKYDHEITDLVPKWPHGTKMPIKKDEGRSYITYINEYGNVKETKYLNNGKYIDMSKEEREKFIAEVQIVNEELSDAIEEYQKNNTMENWKKVRKAMAQRIALDKKYGVLSNQKELTIKTLGSTIDETIGEVGKPKKLREKEELMILAMEKNRDDEDEYDPRDPRANFRSRF